MVPPERSERAVCTRCAQRYANAEAPAEAGGSTRCDERAAQTVTVDGSMPAVIGEGLNPLTTQ